MWTQDPRIKRYVRACLMGEKSFPPSEPRYHSWNGVEIMDLWRECCDESGSNIVLFANKLLAKDRLMRGGR